jgi:hypothetical protein
MFCSFFGWRRCDVSVDQEPDFHDFVFCIFCVRYWGYLQEVLWQAVNTSPWNTGTLFPTQSSVALRSAALRPQLVLAQLSIFLVGILSTVTGCTALCGPLPLSSAFLLNFSTYGRTAWTCDQSVSRPLPTQDNVEGWRTNIRALNGVRTRDPVYERWRPKPRTARPPDRLLMRMECPFEDDERFVDFNSSPGDGTRRPAPLCTDIRVGLCFVTSVWHSIAWPPIRAAKNEGFQKPTRYFEAVAVDGMIQR